MTEQPDYRAGFANHQDAPAHWAARHMLPLLFVVQFLTWVGMFTLWVFSLPLVAALLPAGSGLAAPTRIVGMLLALYVGLAALIGLALPRVHARFGKVRTHALALLVGAAGLIAAGHAPVPAALFGCFAAVAVGWASITSTPYSLVSDRVQDGRYTRALGIFNFSTVIPQVVVALCLAPLTERLTPGVAVSAGGTAMALAGVVMLALSLAVRD